MGDYLRLTACLLELERDYLDPSNNQLLGTLEPEIEMFFWKRLSLAQSLPGVPSPLSNSSEHINCASKMDTYEGTPSSPHQRLTACSLSADASFRIVHKHTRLHALVLLKIKLYYRTCISAPSTPKIVIERFLSADLWLPAKVAVVKSFLPLDNL